MLLKTKIIVSLLLLELVSVPIVGGQQQHGLELTVPDAITLVANSPDAIVAKRSGACIMPAQDFGTRKDEPYTVYFQIRNHCPKFGSGLIGNYHVDLRSGTLYLSTATPQIIDSPTLRQLRKRLLSRNNGRDRKTSEKSR